MVERFDPNAKLDEEIKINVQAGIDFLKTNTDEIRFEKDGSRLVPSNKLARNLSDVMLKDGEASIYAASRDRVQKKVLDEMENLGYSKTTEGDVVIFTKK